MKGKFILAAVATIALTACSNNESSNEQVAIQVKAGFGATTRAIGENWDNDNIGISVVGDTKGSMSTIANVQYSTSSTSDVAAFSATSGDGIIFPVGYDGTATFAAYAPYSSNINDDKLSIDTQKNNDSSKNQEKNLDILFAIGATATLSKPSVEFVGQNGFSHKMAQINFTINTINEEDFTAKIADATSITLGGLKHKGSFNIKTGEITLSEDAAVSNWDIKDLNKTVDGDAYTYSLMVIPQEVSSALPLSITIDGKTFTNKTSIKPDITAGGKSYTYTINVHGKSGGIEVSGCTVENWDTINGGSGDAYQD